MEWFLYAGGKILFDALVMLMDVRPCLVNIHELSFWVAISRSSVHPAGHAAGDGLRHLIFLGGSYGDAGVSAYGQTVLRDNLHAWVGS